MPNTPVSKPGIATLEVPNQPLAMDRPWGRNATTNAPKNAPWMVPRPPITIIIRSWIEITTVNVSLFTMPEKYPINAPARPVMAQETPKAVILVREM